MEGKTGLSAAVPLAVLPQDFAAGTLIYTAATRRLDFALGGTNVSLTLGGSYASVSTYGCGAAAMEGEMTQPFQAAQPLDAPCASAIRMIGADLQFDLRFSGDNVFEPQVERSVGGLGSFTEDRSALVQNLGGGCYRISAPVTTGQSAEFFRVILNQP